MPTQAVSRPPKLHKQPLTIDAEIVSVDEATLAREWKADQKASIQKYANKRIEVKGTVLTASSNNSARKPMVILYGSTSPDDLDAFQTIQCVFPISAEENVDNLATGQAVKIRGRLDANAGAGIPIMDCTLVDSGPSTAITATPEKLVADFEKDPCAAEQRYNKKPVLVTGKIVGMEWEEGYQAVKFHLAEGNVKVIPAQ